MSSTTRPWLVIISISFLVLLTVSYLMSDEQYLLISIMGLGLAFLPFIFRFEQRKVSARELVLLALLAAIAAVSRVPFAPLPGVQPTSFVIMVAAFVFGPEAGFLIGATAALVSNMFLGQGPWTMWQMFGWGMMGATAGWLRYTFIMQSLYGKLVFGFVWGFLFGWIMNVWYLISLPDAFSWQLVVAAYMQSFYFDLAHALSNVFFLLVFEKGWSRVLLRFKKKYGLITG